MVWTREYHVIVWFNRPELDSSLTSLTLKMTSAQVVEMSVTTTDNSPSQDYTHPDDQTTLLHTHTHTYIYLYIHKVFWNIPEAYVIAIFSDNT